MNLFEITLISSIVAGVVVGIDASESAAMSKMVCGGVGFIFGILGFGVSVMPGIVVMELAGKGVSQSKMSKIGGMLLFAGAFGSPVLAYYLAMSMVADAIKWLS